MKKICPKCQQEYTRPPALSREDNKTEICEKCGTAEAIAAMGGKFDEIRKAVDKIFDEIVSEYGELLNDYKEN